MSTGFYQTGFNASFEILMAVSIIISLWTTAELFIGLCFAIRTILRSMCTVVFRGLLRRGMFCGVLFLRKWAVTLNTFRLFIFLFTQHTFSVRVHFCAYCSFHPATLKLSLLSICQIKIVNFYLSNKNCKFLFVKLF